MSGRVLPFIGSREPWQSGAQTEHITCLLAPNPSPMTLDGTNTWLVADGRHAVVIDPGPADPGHLRAIADWVHERDLLVDEIVLTHGHIDHSASARQIATMLSASRVRALDPALRLGDEGLGQGATVAVGDLALRVVHTPGHSSDSVSLVLTDDASVLSGDTVLGRGTSVVSWPDGNLRDYLDSLARLRDALVQHGVTTVLPGHGPRLDDAVGVIDAYVEHRWARLDQVRDALAGGARTVDEVVAVVYADSPAAVLGAAASSVRAQLEFLGVTES